MKPNTPKPDWSQIFNSDLKREPGRWPHMRPAWEAARAAGYPFMLWSGRIYDIRPSPTDDYVFTGWVIFGDARQAKGTKIEAYKGDS